MDRTLLAAVLVRPGRQRTLRSHQCHGYLLWDVLVAAALWRAAVLYRRQRRRLDPAEHRAVVNLTNWAAALFCLSLLANADDLVFVATGAFDDPGQWVPQARSAVHAWWLSALAGAVLLLVARASGRLRRGGVALAVVAAVPGVLPSAVGLDAPAFVRPETHGHSWYTIGVVAAAALASSLLLVVSTWAAAWRLLRDAGLLRRRAVDFPLGRALAFSAGGVALTAVSQAAAKERDWLRGSWPSALVDPTYRLWWTDGTLISHNVGYGAWHEAELRSGLLWSATYAQGWWTGTLWTLTALAMLAFLYVTAHRRVGVTPPAAQPPVLSTEPSPAEQWLLRVSLPAVVLLFLWVYAANSAPALLWFLIDLAALSLCLRLGIRRAVLYREVSDGRRLGDLLTVADRPQLLDAARGHREKLAKLRRLDHGQSDEAVVDRRLVEEELRLSRRWVRARDTAQHYELPPDVTAVDAVLALGPGDTWWQNATTAARYSALLSLPFAGLLTWVQTLRGDALTGTLHDRFGIFEVIWSPASWIVAFASAGFLLGALWRRLPGRHGPMKALLLAVAYAVPVGLFAVGNQLLGEEQGVLAFASASILLVLTLTAVAVDLHTFRTERAFRPSRIQLLFSVYQIRFLSPQIAWVLAQLVAVVTLWQFFGAPDTPPSGGGSVSR